MIEPHTQGLVAKGHALGHHHSRAHERAREAAVAHRTQPTQILEGVTPPAPQAVRHDR